MLDVNPGLRSAYELYKAAKTGKEEALDRINGRREKLANMPAPINLIINLAQLVGFEYEYRPADMRDEYKFSELMFSYGQYVAQELSRTPGEYPLSSLWFHRNAMINLTTGKPQPWEANFSTEIEGEYFSTSLKAEQVLARRADKPLVSVRPDDSPFLYLPEGYRMVVCNEPSWRCQDQYETCRPATELRITGLSDEPKLLS